MAGSSDAGESPAGRTRFRAAAVDHLRSPERLDQVVSVTRTRSWLAVVAGLLGVAAFFTWAVVATIPVRTTVGAIMTRPAATAEAFAPVPGHVATVAVAPGDRVARGDSLATVVDDTGASTDVGAPTSGVVQSLSVSPGQPVEAGTRIAALVNEGSQAALQAVTYVTAADALQLREIAEVTVQPATVDDTQYGALVGTVAFVADLPASRVEMARELGSDALATSFLDVTDVPYLVVVEFSSPARWTDGPASPLTITDGTPAQVSAIVQNYRPIDLILG